MTIDNTKDQKETVDKGQVKWFLSLSAEERIAFNEKRAKEIQELRDAFKSKNK